MLGRALQLSLSELHGVRGEAAERKGLVGGGIREDREHVLQVHCTQESVKG